MDKLQKINYDVLNTLNLMSRSLGDAYLLEGYNPFDEDYILDIENSRKLLYNLKQKEEIEMEEFLEGSNKSVLETFMLAKENTDLLLEHLSILAQNKKLKNVSVLLKNRSKLLDNAINKIKSGNFVVFELYKEIEGLDMEYREYLKRTYYKDFDLKVTIQNFINLINVQTKQKNLRKKIEKTQEKIAETEVQKTSVKVRSSQKVKEKDSDLQI